MKIIWYSEIKWNYLQTRKHNLIKYFASNDIILFFQPFSFVGSNCFLPKKNDNVYYITLPTYRKSNYKLIDLLMSFTIIRKLYYLLLKIYSKFWIFIILKQVPDCICISNIFYLDLIKKSQIPVIWDYNDDPEQFGKQPKWAIKDFNIFLSSNYKIISCSKSISEYLFDKYRCKTITIPNGVDLFHFNKSKERAKQNNKIIIGYIGIISSWFFDFELIKEIAQNFNDCEIQLYGPCDREVKSKLDDLLKLKNIKYYNSQAYSKLPYIIKKFSVGIIPLYSIPEVWRAASGKLLQYLAVGIPVVSVRMNQYLMMKKNVYFAETHFDFIIGLEKALNHKFKPMYNELKIYDWKALSDKFRNELLNSNE